MSRVLGEALVRVRPSTEGFAKETESGVSSGMGRVGSVITGALKKALVAGAVGVGVASGAALLTGFKSAVNIQNAQKTLAGLYGSTSQATRELKLLRKVASDSPIDYSSYTKGAESLAYMGIKGKEASKILDNVGDAVTAAGGSGEEMQRATDAMLKMVNAGKVQLDTLNQLSEAGVPIFSGLAKHFNTNIAHVREMVTNGKVGIDDVLGVVKHAEGSTFKQMIRASKSASTSVSNQWKIAKDNVATSLGFLFKPALKPLGKLFADLNGQFIKLSGRFEKEYGPRIRKSMRAGLSGVDIGSIFDKVGDKISGVDWASVGDALAGVGRSLKDLGPFFAQLLKELPGVSDIFSIFSRVLRFAADHVDLLVKAIPFLIAGLIAYKVAQLAANVAALASVPLRIAEVAATRAHTKAMLQDATARGTNTAAMQVQTATTRTGLLMLIRQRLATLASAAAQKIAAGATKAYAVAQRVLNAAMRANPIGLVITALLLLGSGLVLAYKKSETFRKIVNGALDAVKAAAKAVTGWFTKSFVPFFTKTIPAAFQSVLKWVKGHWPLLLGILTGPVGLFIAAFVTYRKQIFAGFRGAWTWVKGTFKGLWGGVKGILSAPVQGGRQAIGGAFDKVRGLFRSVKDWVVGVFKRAWNGLKTILTDPVQAGRNILDNLLGKSGRVRNIFDSIVGWVTGFFKREWRGIKAIFTDPVQAAKDIFHNLLGPGGRVRTIFHNAVSAIGGIWDKLKNVAKKPIKFVVNTVLNKGLIDAFNWVSGKFGIKAIPHIPLPKGFRTGGSTGPGPQSRVAGVVHGNEHVWTAEEVAKAGGHGVMERMRRMVRGYVNGGRVWPLPGGTPSTYKDHDGVDLNAPNDYGKPFLAAAGGRISYVGWGRGYGDAIFEKGPYGELVYGHSSQPLVRAGQIVSAGQALGLVGATGHATGPHLHFGFPGGTYAQALAFLHGAAVKGAPGGGGGFNPLSAFTGKISDVLDKIGGLKDSYFGKLVAAIPSRLVEMLKDAVAKFGTAAGVGTSVAAQNTPGFGLLGAVGSHLFDDGGVARGTGYMPKKIIRPERVLNSRDSESFEELVKLLRSGHGVGGRSGPLFGDVYVSEPVDVDMLMKRAGFALSAGVLGG